MKGYSNSWLILDKKALIHNIKQFKKIIGDKVDLICVVKSNAYGHGIELISKVCDQQAEVAKLATVNLQEALYLREVGIKKPIIILSYYDLDNDINNFKLIKNLEFVVYHKDQAIKLNNLAKKIRKNIKIHLKIDSGTSRLGILPKEVVPFAKKIITLKNLEFYGIFTHYAAVEENNQEFTLKQTKRFSKVIKELSKNGINPVLKHAACSAAILTQKTSHFNAVRLGISLYGLWSLEDHKNDIKKQYPWFELKPVLSWKSKIIQIKKLSKGTTIGYGRTYKLKKTSNIAIVPVGYWEGYDRKLSNKARVLIHGQRCLVLGRICMNLIMVEITKIKNVKINEAVVLLGKQGREEITVDELAKLVGTINYEIATRLNPLIQRLLK